MSVSNKVQIFKVTDGQCPRCQAFKLIDQYLPNVVELEWGKLGNLERILRALVTTSTINLPIYLIKEEKSSWKLFNPYFSESE